jgi:hypothetical protein
MKMKILLVLATLIVAVSLVNAGCIGAIRSNIDDAFATPTPVPTATATPNPTNAPTITPNPTPIYYMPDHVDVIFISPYYSGITPSYITHVINGSISFNNQPAVGWGIIIHTSAGNEFGNVTDANGRYQVTFAGDMNETYTVKLVDPANNLIYMDQLPRRMNHVGPISINMTVPTTGVYTLVIITPQPEGPLGSFGLAGQP